MKISNGNSCSRITYTILPVFSLLDVKSKSASRQTMFIFSGMLSDPRHPMRSVSIVTFVFYHYNVQLKCPWCHITSPLVFNSEYVLYMDVVGPCFWHLSARDRKEGIFGSYYCGATIRDSLLLASSSAAK